MDGVGADTLGGMEKVNVFTRLVYLTRCVCEVSGWPKRDGWLALRPHWEDTRGLHQAVQALVGGPDPVDARVYCPTFRTAGWRRNRPGAVGRKSGA